MPGGNLYTRVLWYGFPLVIGAIIFGNHFSRDSVGALEKQLEASVLTPQEFYKLNSLFFAPNIITPFLAGNLAKHLGGAAVCMFSSVTLGALGHIIVAYGVSVSSVGWIMCGRLIAGTMYEVIDTMPIIMLGPLYRDHMGVLSGTVNSFLRLGSVFNFIMCPYLYQHYSLGAAFWFSAFINAFGTVFALLSIYFERHLLSAKRGSEVADGSPTTTISGGELSVLVSGPDSSAEGDAQFLTATGRAMAWLKFTFPLHRLSTQFYWFALSGSLLYGSMVPFWFIGSKYLQDFYGLTVGSADTLMLLPEGLIVVVAIPLGTALDRYGWSVRSKLMLLSASISCLPLAYVLLILGLTPPLVSLCILGMGYACSNSIFWGVCTLVTGSAELLGPAGGVLGSAVNIFPSLLPSIADALFGANDTVSALWLLAIAGCLGSVCAVVAAYRPEFGHEDDTVDSNGHSVDGSRCEAVGAIGSSSSYEMVSTSMEDDDRD